MLVSYSFKFMCADLSGKTNLKFYRDLKSGDLLKNIPENLIPLFTEYLDNMYWAINNFTNSEIYGVLIPDYFFSCFRKNNLEYNISELYEIPINNIPLIFHIIGFNKGGKIFNAAKELNGNPEISTEFQDFISKVISYNSDYLLTNVWNEYLSMDELKFYKILMEK